MPQLTERSMTISLNTWRDVRHFSGRKAFLSREKEFARLPKWCDHILKQSEVRLNFGGFFIFQCCQRIHNGKGIAGFREICSHFFILYGRSRISRRPLSLKNQFLIWRDSAALCGFIDKKSVYGEWNVEDITIRCIQCGDEFVFTAGEQRYYVERDFSSPKRCPACRKKKAKMSDSTQGQKNRNRKDE